MPQPTETHKSGLNPPLLIQPAAKSQALPLFSLLLYYLFKPLFIPFAVSHIYRSVPVKTKSEEAVAWVKHKLGVSQEALDPLLCHYCLYDLENMA